MTSKKSVIERNPNDKNKKETPHALAFFSFVAHHVKFCKHVHELLLSAAIM
jgi:hypothetical protein